MIEGKLQPDYILLKIEALKHKWMDSALIHQKLIQAIMTRQGTIQILQRKIECALYAIRESRRLRNQPDIQLNTDPLQAYRL
ncbi:MAG: hypothetical protein Q7U40_01105 [Desulfatirhabdiaceae bacterium]|nr:hypothetical protein [Desulfatirhabdiaceae bacterium]